jgi:predicted enzyme related to lactoylglutathione lyase
MYDRSGEKVEWFGGKILKKQVQKRAYMIKITDPVMNSVDELEDDRKMCFLRKRFGINFKKK